jgi:transposase InsO family protein
VHTVIDDHSRVAYAEICADEKADTAIAVLHRARRWFADRGVIIERVLSDNGSAYRSHTWAQACTELGIVHKRTRPYRPQTNGKICEDLQVVQRWPGSDSGQGVTVVSCVRCVGRCWRCAVVRAGRTGLT